MSVMQLVKLEQVTFAWNHLFFQSILVLNVILDQPSFTGAVVPKH